MQDSKTNRLYPLAKTAIAFCCAGTLLMLFAHTAKTETKTTINQSAIEALIARSKQQTNAGRMVEYAEQAINIADSLGLDEPKADAMHQSGIAWKVWGDQLKSIERLTEAMELFRALGLEEKLYSVKTDLGETYRAARSYDMAMDELNEALSFFTEQVDSIMLATTYNRMAAISLERLFTHPDYVRLDESGFQGKEMFLENLAQYPEPVTLYTSTKKYLGSSNKMADALGLTGISLSNMNIEASLLKTIHDPEGALALYNELIDRTIETGVTDDLPLAYINKARIMGSHQMGSPEESIALALTALDMAKDQEINIYIFMAYEVLQEQYFALGNYRKAYESLIANRGIFEQFNYENLQLISTTYMLENQIVQRELELQGRRNQIAMMVASIIFILVFFAAFVFILAAKNRKQRFLLTELQKRNQIITDQNELLALSNAEKDKLFSIIAHDLKAPFQSILGFSEILKDEGDTLNKEEAKTLSGLLHTSTSRTWQLLDDLLSWARLQQDRINFAPENIPVAQIVHFISDLLHDAATKKNIKITSQLHEDLVMKADKEMLKTILRNLVSNAIKFSYPGTEVIVSASASNGNIIISVSDSGIGIPKDKIKDLFSVGNEHIMPGTAKEKGTGLGLVLCREFVEKHSGQIRVESNEGKGSVFSFTLPKT